ncbi:lysine 2,3-aminomutase [Sedimentisphaera salicampi]|uniref:L-lysine 2,3-aminomutase n=1 Tax=Sedimentisphaera salicampi TaxID=1941349 RepID=A0A1W6LP23_9BACT|nr:lysine 2,3-aminomutase [Sedimentisphaera salicampi]ARN57483.1 L-lysine 2,3-aminomutase [Sedimentisphaera salicampi]OXU14494.1 L-lysine 2,3-aminomutase [Sedimentisphaera salicampi]
MKLTSNQRQIFDNIDSDAALSKWQDWKWQIKHCVHDLKTFEELLEVKLPEEVHEQFKKTVKKFPMSITPYYLSLINTDDILNDPIFMQGFPSGKELDIDEYDMEDPLHEDNDSPMECITHRYPDRVLFMVSNTCSMYCRHCTRKRRVGDKDSIPNKKELLAGIEYIKNHPQIRDVLLSGGDPFLLSDNMIDWLLTELRAIESVEIIRIGTRTPVVLPQRITPELVEILKKHQPVWVNTHFNHPREITSSSRRALRLMADGGLPLGNQSVLLAGVNDCPRIMRALVHKLAYNRVRPYYLYQCDLSEGLSHFRTPIGKGIEIIESLIGHTSGFCVPTYVIDAPGGGGKIPVMPNYLISWSTNKVVLRNYEGVITTYNEPNSYEPSFCDRKCEKCNLQLSLDDADEYKSLGISKLLGDYDETISLVPENNSRHERRDSYQ